MKDFIIGTVVILGLIYGFYAAASLLGSDSTEYYDDPSCGGIEAATFSCEPVQYDYDSSAFR